MRRANSYELIQIGLVVRFLRAPEGQPRKDVLESIGHINHTFQSIGFHVSLKGLRELTDFEGELSNSDMVKLDASMASRLTAIMQDVETILTAEAQTKDIFLVEERRYNLRFLLDSPAGLFAPNVFAELPDLSRYDLTEGSKCIAFGSGTAAAFHILRATEGVLKGYYFHHIRRNRERTPMWGNMLTGLRAKKRNRPSETLLNSLDLIRTSYRNPTNHPEAVYSLEEAEDLLGLCIDVVNKMTVEMADA